MKTRTALIFASAICLIGQPAHAELQYGPWTQTRDCRTVNLKGVLGRSGIPIPTGTGASRQECKWEREITDCPKISDKLAHPIKCFRKRELSGYSEYQPRG
jgi:hypothetical protein